MIRYIAGILGGFLSFTLLWLFFIALQLNNPTITTRWVYDVYTKKRQIAQSLPASPRIVLIGGSSVLFGFDAKMLEDYFHIPAINYGVNAGLLLPITLFMAKEVLRPGDIAVMSLEYPMFTYSGRLNEQAIGFILSRRPDFFYCLTVKEQLFLLTHTTLRTVLEGFAYTDRGQQISGVYGAHNIDDHGNQINTGKTYRTPALFSDVQNSDVRYYGKEFKNNTLGLKYIRDFVSWAKNNNIHTVFTPVPFLKKTEYFDDPVESYFYKNLPDILRSNDINYIGNPYDFMFEEDDFFNSDYHLTAESRLIATKKLIHLLSTIPH